MRVQFREYDYAFERDTAGRDTTVRRPQECPVAWSIRHLA